MAWLDKLHHPENYIKMFLKWGLLGIVLGANPVAILLPLLFVRPVLLLAEFFRKKGD